MGEAKNKTTKEPQVKNLGMFKTEEERDSWYRWLSYADDQLKRVCLPIKRLEDQLKFRHREDGPDPLESVLLEIKIEKLHSVRLEFLRKLGWKGGNESAYNEIYYHWNTRKTLPKAAVTMAEMGIIKHWEPPKDSFITKKHNPRRPVDEQGLKDREKHLEESGSYF